MTSGGIRAGCLESSCIRWFKARSRTSRLQSGNSASLGPWEIKRRRSPEEKGSSSCRRCKGPIVASYRLQQLGALLMMVGSKMEGRRISKWYQHHFLKELLTLRKRSSAWFLDLETSIHMPDTSHGLQVLHVHTLEENTVNIANYRLELIRQENEFASLNFSQ